MLVARNFLRNGGPWNSSTKNTILLRQITTTPLPHVSVNNNNGVDKEGMVVNLLRPFHEQQSPVILQDYAKSWPALKQWQDWDYLLARIGEEWHCDVEMGAYNNSQEGRLSIPFGAYLDYLRLYQEQQQTTTSGVDEPAPPMLYLAQNDLPHELYPDIVLPPFLQSNNSHLHTTTTTTTSTTSAILGQGKLYQCMFWMGPSGVESPLHFDPLDNLLCQVVGTKQVALLDRHAASHEVLHAGAAYGQQENTSALPMQSLLQSTSASSSSSSSSASLDKLNFLTGTLQPGDALYIPSKWWHYVSSSSTDFTISVNVWWR